MNLFWELIKKISTPKLKPNTKICVIIGFPRSGTSLLCKLVEGCGYSFGKNLRKASQMNPLGFYENRKILRESDRMMQQCNFSVLNYDKETNLLARPLKRIARLKSRYIIAREMNRAISTCEKVAFKLTPIPFHLIKAKLSKYKIIGIYRNPIDSVASNIHSGKKNYTFNQLLRRWAMINEEMLYHVIENEGLLISYDELTNPDFTNKVLNAVAKYLESKSVDPSLIQPSLKRTNASINFENIYEPNLDVARILRSLENYKKESTKKYS